MSADIFAGKSKAEIAAIIEAGKAALKAGIQPSHPLVRDIVEIVNDIVKQEGVTAEKVLAAVKAAIGGKTGSTGGTKKKSFRDVMSAAIKEEDETVKHGPKVSTEEIEKDFIARFGQEKYEALKAEYPPSPSAKYKK